MSAGQRLMVYDRTCRGPWWRPGLSHSWWTGGHLYSLVGRLDAWEGFDTWPAALEWLVQRAARGPIAKIQFWGHGKWGQARVDREVLDLRSLEPEHVHAAPLRRIAEAMSGQDALWWFRTCETLGAEAGHAFAKEWSRFFDAHVAGHTFIIGPWQSGLHCLAPGVGPDWSVHEGLAEGTPAEPKRALWSRPWHTNTISCLHGEIPKGFVTAPSAVDAPAAVP